MEFISFTMSDGYKISVRYWQGTRKDSVLYIHGIQSHGLWFEESASVLAGAGFSVFLPDRRGSGLNERLRGDISHFSRWLDDLCEIISLIKSEYKSNSGKIHILAVSWGGKLAMGLAKLCPEQIASLTLIAPGLFPRVDVAVSDKIAIANALLHDSRKLFPIPLNEPELFTDNPERQKFIVDDKQKLTHVSARFLYQSRKLDKFIKRGFPVLPFPMKLFLAGRDRIIDNCKTLRFYRGIKTSVRKELAFYPSAAHTIEFEEDNREFLRDIKGWILLCEDVLQ